MLMTSRFLSSALISLSGGQTHLLNTVSSIECPMSMSRQVSPEWNFQFSLPISAIFCCPHLLHLSRWHHVSDGLHQTYLQAILHCSISLIPTPNQLTCLFGYGFKIYLPNSLKFHYNHASPSHPSLFGSLPQLPKSSPWIPTHFFINQSNFSKNLYQIISSCLNSPMSSNFTFTQQTE